MATLTKSPYGSLPSFWNVDASVGRGCPNKLYDVYLVQFFMTKIYASQKLPAAYLPKGVVQVNGTWHDTMYEAIWLSRNT